MLSEEQKVSTAPASEALADAIRGIVREELERASIEPSLAEKHEPPKEEPNWQDGFWLLVLIANIALVVTLIPEHVWKDPVFDIPGKILPWLGGGTFVLGATWFREQLLRFSRKRTFKIVMACAFVPLLMLQVPFITLNPTVSPPDSQLYVDDVQRQGSFQGSEKVPLRLRSHTFTIKPHYAGAAGDRVIDWGWARLLRAWWKNEHPHWALVYPMRIVTDGQGCTVHIRKSDPKEKPDSDFYDVALKTGTDSYEFMPSRTSETISLPAGKYSISVEKSGCDPQEYPRNPVTVPSPGSIAFDPMKCDTK